MRQWLHMINELVWGPAMLLLLTGTGVFLTVRTRFLAWRNLGWALRYTLSSKARQKGEKNGDISPFSALTTALAATIGTGNIVGVAAAMTAGGPGAVVWMWISACFGLTSKFAECMLAVKYRERNEKGEMCGGPMYTMEKGISNRWFGRLLAVLFAFSAVLASFGIGNMTQAHSITSALYEAAKVPPQLTGILLTGISFVIIIGGIQSISRISSYIVPFMAVFYIAAGLMVILGNIRNVPAGLLLIFRCAFDARAVTGGVLGNVIASMGHAVRYGVARGCFSNEAGMGSAAISAAAATSDDPVRQGYINMTGTFWDTLVVCSITALCIASSGVLGRRDAVSGDLISGSALTIDAFETVFGPAGGWLITIGIVLFAFSTILGWEYQGEKAFEYLLKTHRWNLIYRLIFLGLVYAGSVMSFHLVWNLSDVANALMAVPNLICLLILSREIAEDMQSFRKEL
ncbi:MAG: sodium:alanine symporter family protein [Lachnospiraceae bacterium]|nr:sodium:alanine symporter family protein [Lachnospiraceae bacterium]